MKHTMQRRQEGMTFIGLLCILTMAGAIVYAGIRLIPVYLNYMNIVQTLETTASDFKGDNPDPGAIRNALARHWEITTISAVDYKDVEITKDENGVTLHVVYDDSEPYLGNVSLAVHFDKTVKVR
jgi:Domain of unknown function (DUF4845)